MFIRIPKYYDRGSTRKPKETIFAAMRSRGDWYGEESYDSEDDYYVKDDEEDEEEGEDDLDDDEEDDEGDEVDDGA